MESPTVQPALLSPVPLLDLLLVVSGVLLQKIDVVLGQGVRHFLAPLLVFPPLPWNTAIVRSSGLQQFINFETSL